MPTYTEPAHCFSRPTNLEDSPCIGSYKAPYTGTFTISG